MSIPKNIFSITHEDEQMHNLMAHCDQRTLAKWAIICAEHVLPLYTDIFTHDPRPSKAISTLREWLRTGVFHMRVIRKASLDAHAAARDVGSDSPARSAARAAGQAVATAHVPRHAYGPAIYGQQAVFRNTDSLEEAAKERDWQYEKLLELMRKNG